MYVIGVASIHTEGCDQGLLISEVLQNMHVCAMLASFPEGGSGRNVIGAMCALCSRHLSAQAAVCSYIA